MAIWQLPTELVAWITQMGSWLHARLAFRLLPLFTGLLMARGRRTVASWLRAAGIGKDFRDYYYFLGSLGRNIKSAGCVVLAKVLGTVPLGERILMALDDSPTKRYGKWVEGAGLHHNPTPGPADQKFVYGHVWGTLGVQVRHAMARTIGLPSGGLLYQR